ncbi:hypothetical protein Tco_0529926 [Tanacetum coccineum]
MRNGFLNDRQKFSAIQPHQCFKPSNFSLPERNITKCQHEVEVNSIGLVPNPLPQTPYVPPTKKDWDTLFQPMFDEYFNPPSSVASPVPAVVAPDPAVVALGPADSTGTPSSTIIDQDAPSPSYKNLYCICRSQEHDSLSNICEDCILKRYTIAEESTIGSPDRFDRSDQDNPNHVYKLKKAIYGLKQAP